MCVAGRSKQLEKPNSVCVNLNLEIGGSLNTSFWFAKSNRMFSPDNTHQKSKGVYHKTYRKSNTHQIMVVIQLRKTRLLFCYCSWYSSVNHPSEAQ